MAYARVRQPPRPRLSVLFEEYRPTRTAAGRRREVWRKLSILLAIGVAAFAGYAWMGPLGLAKVGSIVVCAIGVASALTKGRTNVDRVVWVLGALCAAYVVVADIGSTSAFKLMVLSLVCVTFKRRNAFSRKWEQPPWPPPYVSARRKLVAALRERAVTKG